MPPKFCVIYVETNGLHKSRANVSKKYLFEYARPVVLNYIIGFRNNGEFNEIKKERYIFRPDYMLIPDECSKIHGITREIAFKKGLDKLEIMNKLKDDLKDVDIIVSHNIKFHLQALQAECFRTCTYIDFSRFLLIDTSSFQHGLEYPRLKDLAKHLFNKDYSDKKSKYNLVLIKKCFLELYDRYEKSVLSK